MHLHPDGGFTYWVTCVLLGGALANRWAYIALSLAPGIFTRINQLVMVIVASFDRSTY